MKAVFIKLGGSLITDKAKPYYARATAIEQIVQEIAVIHSKHPDLVWFIGNGAGSFGHYAVHESGWREDPTDPYKVSSVRHATHRLNTVILEALLKVDLPVLTLPAAAFIHSNDGQLISETTSLVSYAQSGIVPLVYGDVVFDTKNGSVIASTEEILDQLAKAWVKAGHEASTVVYCTSVDGVLDSAGKAQQTLSRDTKTNFTAVEGYDVTGGMAQKVEAGFRALEYTDYVYIINGRSKGALTSAIAHKNVGTRLVK